MGCVEYLLGEVEGWKGRGNGKVHGGRKEMECEGRGEMGKGKGTVGFEFYPK